MSDEGAGGSQRAGGAGTGACPAAVTADGRAAGRGRRGGAALGRGPVRRRTRRARCWRRRPSTGLAVVPAGQRDPARLGRPAAPLRPGHRHAAAEPGARARRGRPGGPGAGRGRPWASWPGCSARPGSSWPWTRRPALGQRLGTAGAPTHRRVLATGAAGPRRLRYGTPRDLVIGITVVRADGTVAKSGGKVVKNVAGYDLGKLFAGSYGTLGLITEAVFRLHPLPGRGRVRHRGLRRPGRGQRRRSRRRPDSTSRRWPWRSTGRAGTAWSGWRCCWKATRPGWPSGPR